MIILMIILAIVHISNVLPSAILSDVASRFIQKATHESITNKQHGTYTLIRKYPIWRLSLKSTDNTVCQAVKYQFVKF